MGVKKNRSLYRGVFNFSCGSEIKYAYAYSPAQAKVIMMQRMAREHGLIFQVVAGRFKGDIDNFKIETEMEFKEVDNEETD